MSKVLGKVDDGLADKERFSLFSLRLRLARASSPLSTKPPLPSSASRTQLGSLPAGVGRVGFSGEAEALADAFHSFPSSTMTTKKKKFFLSFSSRVLLLFPRCVRGRGEAERGESSTAAERRETRETSFVLLWRERERERAKAQRPPTQ